VSTFKELLQRFKDAELIPVMARLPGQDQPVYFKPVTLADNDKVRRHMKAEGSDSEAVSVCLTVIFKLCDEAGNLIFDISDRSWIMSTVPQSLLNDIVGEMAAANVTLEEAEKN
jgi:hypothetical protein